MITVHPVRSCPHCHQPVDNPHARNCIHCGDLLPLEAGSIVGGQYRILQPIGEGGSGSLYLAEDGRTFNRRCVLKRLHAIHNADERARFVAEVQTLTRLRHPQIPQVYAFFEEHSQPFMVMEYVAGPDLEHGLSATLNNGQVLTGKPHAIRETLLDGMTVCSILEHLHSRTPPLVHCDVKPANLIRDTESNALFLVDFGAAMNVGAGENFGTPGYAAPEQYRGQQTTASDVYALAATLYHLMTDDDPSDHPHRFPKLGRLPQAIAEVLKAALHTEPAERPTATRFRQELERCLNLPGIQNNELRAPSGAAIQTSDELTAAAFQDWGWFTDAAIEGRLQEWLQDNNQFQLLHWFNQQRLTLPLDGILHDLIVRLNPLAKPAEVRLGQTHINLSLVNLHQPHPLNVTTRGGIARVRVKLAPPWLRVTPNELQMRPGQTAAFQLVIDAQRSSFPNGSGSIELEAHVGAHQPLHLKIPVSIGTQMSAPPQPQISTLLFAWMIVLGITMALIIAAPPALIVASSAGIGAFVASTLCWAKQVNFPTGLKVFVMSLIVSISAGSILPMMGEVPLFFTLTMSLIASVALTYTIKLKP